MRSCQEASWTTTWPGWTPCCPALRPLGAPRPASAQLLGGQGCHGGLSAGGGGAGRPCQPAKAMCWQTLGPIQGGHAFVCLTPWVACVLLCTPNLVACRPAPQCPVAPACWICSLLHPWQELLSSGLPEVPLICLSCRRSAAGGTPGRSPKRTSTRKPQGPPDAAEQGPELEAAEEAAAEEAPGQVKHAAKPPKAARATKPRVQACSRQCILCWQRFHPLYRVCLAARPLSQLIRQRRGLLHKRSGTGELPQLTFVHSPEAACHAVPAGCTHKRRLRHPCLTRSHWTLPGPIGIRVYPKP